MSSSKVTAREGTRSPRRTAGTAANPHGDPADRRVAPHARPSRTEDISVGVILGFPADIAAELQRWRASFGDPLADVVPAHITLVTTTPTKDWEATREHVRDVARRQRPFTVTIAGTGTFRPVSPVVFINVEDGFEDCVDLHEKLQQGPLHRELPFAYHPHVTIAHDVAPESLDEAETVLRNYRATFPVVSMGLYEHDANGIWQLREELDFGTQTDNDGGA
ncbi:MULTISPECIES: 2'-5' RNA ligase family protein [Pseudarthrobacter]|jgi:2'-5' RNA ligase|uniref:2'-5' RNA ligase family protein n=1 Tax=Pseudarthrobacter TaxID=1742993 RepID=UPI001E54CE21|nr:MULTISPECIES: 2'-5' RNA ligase family protein [Pseudarthrobacter]WPU10556.1 2'-5' RNA ligase family protein [Pseudarthrobacter oxydans]HET7781858.1 2'-5' RNA ligase family protein [Arthrobacter sp.]